jgi:hypothetical protein
VEGDKEALDANTRRALSDFYREEFLRHLQHLESNGFVHDGNRAVMDRACAKLMTDRGGDAAPELRGPHAPERARSALGALKASPAPKVPPRP